MHHQSTRSIELEDSSGMTFENTNSLAIWSSPHDRVVVLSSTEENIAIWTVFQISDGSLVSMHKNRLLEYYLPLLFRYHRWVVDRKQFMKKKRAIATLSKFPRKCIFEDCWKTKASRTNIYIDTYGKLNWCVKQHVTIPGSHTASRKSYHSFASWCPMHEFRLHFTWSLHLMSKSYRMHLFWQLLQINYVILLPQTLHMTSNKAKHEILVGLLLILSALALTFLILRLGICMFKILRGIGHFSLHRTLKF